MAEDDDLPDKQAELVNAVAAEAGIEQRQNPALGYLTKKELQWLLQFIRTLRQRAEALARDAEATR